MHKMSLYWLNYIARCIHIDVFQYATNAVNDLLLESLTAKQVMHFLPCTFKQMHNKSATMDTMLLFQSCKYNMQSFHIVYVYILCISIR